MWFLLLACAPVPPDITTFDASCTEASDCAVVYTEVDTCACSCDTAALSTSGAAAWEEDVDTYQASLPEQCMLDCAACPPLAEPTCEGTVCELGE